ncbi:lactate utilization protein C [Agarivorans sp. 1_MG-2023]|uniref:LutC/YkgG family protein n=1 Tax=Agarivorans sp. 1_MG-2023 TaxID=3062634 RepID=UPI0026E48117|nr:lactate utilization protein C [Agarivorans sp. 1_MG-2023]MDO6763061.1 lactate utilization protein C [Agarivorans sp. 1_MG-2023]
MSNASALAKANIMQRLSAVSALSPKPSTGSHQAWQSPSHEVCLTRFKQQLTNAHAEVISIPNTEQLTGSLIELAALHQWQSAMLGTGGDWHQLFTQALTSRLKLSVFEQNFEQHKSDLFNNTSVSLTGCDAGIADTGTLVLKPSAEEPRSLSLLAPCHVAVIKASQIVDNFALLMAQQQWHHGLPSNVVLISGPSKTADIQQTLAYGAHGPSELIVIVIEGE